MDERSAEKGFSETLVDKESEYEIELSFNSIVNDQTEKNRKA